MTLKVKKLDPRAKIPAYGTEYSAGADLYCILDEPVIIEPHTTTLLSTGLSLEIPVGYCGLIFARSSLGVKKGLAPANKVGVIDADYRGEIGVILINMSNEAQVIEPAERICQMVIAKHEQPQLIEVDVLGETERGAGGFGHSGVK
jgi:dUTP pyrophosphatase